ncbi:MAG: UvrB/UvrC motif-containing protein [Rhabdochlamydiaceae bacterium]|nr:UvrB/UvrC motif-containing protein [Rhabdochlamydiaceae bacterium]
MADKPLECTQCPNAICVTYKEISKNACTSVGMCSNCPILEKKLHGQLQTSSNPENIPKLYCTECLTTLESLEMGSSLGCNQCYANFDKPLLQKLIKEESLPSFFAEQLSNTQIHRGKSPHQAHTISPTQQLATLHEALNDALQKEQYEQAAWLRDQIKEWAGENL